MKRARVLVPIAAGLASAAVLSVSVLAGAPALTVTDTPLKESPDDVSATLAELAEGTSLDLGPRQGPWYEASTSESSGWVRMLNVRLSGAGQRPGDSGARALLQVGRTDATVTTGVRGLTAEELRNARENRAALERMAAMQPPPDEVERFAAEGELASRDVAPPEDRERQRGRGR